ncbi:MAG TPA: SRPBCC domain-containing protein [Candidatus Sulfotelmatobacter sp.]|nr:SRPBCC domain-containing protein [Candidatus Sulfotelmatobacter sp.]
MPEPRHVYQITVRTTPGALWAALTDPEQTCQYWYGARNNSAWTPGSRWTSESAEGESYLEGEILEADPPRRLVHTFHVVHEVEAAADPPSLLEFTIRPTGGVCHLKLVHSRTDPATEAYIEGGWEHILDGLRTYLEGR